LYAGMLVCFWQVECCFLLPNLLGITRDHCVCKKHVV
jgi:hypothetical protein